ncbi:hypothetical protein CAEBREN_07894 [Caenorhabditis brenneri]|uniref:Transmembrane protein n=1 Tax=Caenorhabditis brenneri TaxID=135651 RepID=G0MMM7_CAEBE|nr:hypothetical protein CAEBREN_07894 [Caenorhabditis brenneri]
MQSNNFVSKNYVKTIFQKKILSFIFFFCKILQNIHFVQK